MIRPVARDLTHRSGCAAHEEAYTTLVKIPECQPVVSTSHAPVDKLPDVYSCIVKRRCSY